MKDSSNSKEVLDFLQDLETLSKPSKPVKSNEEIQSFLDEIIKPPPTAKAELSKEPTKQTVKPSASTEPVKQTIAQPSNTLMEEEGDPWSWMWSTAASATAKGLSTAKAMASTVNPAVRELVPDMSRLGNDLSKMAMNLTDNLQSPGLYKKMIVWVCANSPKVTLERLQSFVQETCNEMLCQPFMAAGSQKQIKTCETALVHYVSHPEFKTCQNLQEAQGECEIIKERLSKLISASPTSDTHLMIMIQPVQIQLKGVHIQYLCQLMTPKGLTQMVSQSVGQTPAETIQHHRVIETVISDALEEFILDCSSEKV